jgi:hypothetical protein
VGQAQSEQMKKKLSKVALVNMAKMNKHATNDLRENMVLQCNGDI